MNPTPILQHMQRAYGRLDAPHFGFVREVIRSQPHEALVKLLQQEFGVEEDTDPNDDVSFGYLLTTGEHRWVLRLSMVGPFAVLLRLREDGGVAAIVSEDTIALPQEASLLSHLSDFGVEALPRSVLEQPVDLRMFNAEPENVRVYQALFTDTDVLPWQNVK